MLGLKKIGVTGGVACGKTTACRFFKELGAYVLSADEIVHKLLSPTTTIGQQVIDLIGHDIVVNHQIDRSKIAKKVFNRPQLLQALEDILHQAVWQEMEKQYNTLNTSSPAVPLFVAEIPLLFETTRGAFLDFFDYTIAIVADPETCQQRFQQTTGYDKTEYEKRAKLQMDLSEKARRADFVIFNNGSLSDMKSAIRNLYHQLVNE